MATPDGNTKKGKSISWSDKEKIALALAAHKFCTDPIIKSQQTIAVIGRRIRKQLILDKPSKSDTWRDETECDERRWEERSAESCIKTWYDMRFFCTKLYAIRQKIVCMNLTANPTPGSIDQCTTFEYATGGGKLKAFCACINKKNTLSRRYSTIFRHFTTSLPTKTLSQDAQYAMKMKR